MNNLDWNVIWVVNLWCVLALMLSMKLTEWKQRNIMIKIQQKGLSQNAEGLDNQKNSLLAYTTRKENSQIEDAVTGMTLNRIDEQAKKIMDRWECDLMVRELELEAGNE